MQLYIYAKSGSPIAVPYHPSMLACDYLRDIIAPAAKLPFDAAKVSVVRLVCYKAGRFSFDYASRLEKIGDHIPQGASLHIMPLTLGTYHDLIGNVSQADVKANCAMCFEPSTNFTLACKHRFHDRCLDAWYSQTCPFCRKPYTDKDKEGIMVSILSGELRSNTVTTTPDRAVRYILNRLLF